MIIKKLSILFLCFTLVCLTTFTNPKETQAVAFVGAIPAGIEIGGGAYVLGALTVGGLASAVGLEFGDEITEHAKQTWSKTTALAKSTLYAGMDAANQAGSYIAQVGSDFWDWVSTNSKEIISNAVATTSGSKILTDTPVGNTTVQDQGQTITVSTAFPDFNIIRTSYDFVEAVEINFLSNTFNFVVGTNAYGMVAYKKIKVEVTPNNNRVLANLYTPNLDWSPNAVSTVNIVREYATRTTGNKTKNELSIGETGMTTEQLRASIKAVKTIEDVLALLTSIGLADTVFPGDLSTVSAWNNAWQKTQDDILRLRDAGMVIPTTEAIPKALDTGETLTFNPSANTYTRQDGSPYGGTVSWDFPIPRIYQDSVTGEKAVGVPIGGNITNVYTGDTIIVNNPPLDPPTTPDWTIPKTARLDFVPLVVAGEALTGKFPFSIPWDLKNQLSVFNVQPTTPVIKIDQPNFVTIGEKTFPLKFDIDFTFLDPIAAATRWFFTLAIDIAFILSIRRLLPE